MADRPRSVPAAYRGLEPQDRHCSRWTPGQDSLVRQLHGSGVKVPLIALAMGRTPAAIAARAHALGIRSRRPPRWTPAEDAAIRRAVGRNRIHGETRPSRLQRLADELGRSIRAVRGRAARIGARTRSAATKKKKRPQARTGAQLDRLAARRLEAMQEASP